MGEITTHSLSKDAASNWTFILHDFESAELIAYLIILNLNAFHKHPTALMGQIQAQMVEMILNKKFEIEGKGYHVEQAIKNRKKTYENHTGPLGAGSVLCALIKQAINIEINANEVENSLNKAIHAASQISNVTYQAAKASWNKYKNISHIMLAMVMAINHNNSHSNHTRPITNLEILYNAENILRIMQNSTLSNHFTQLEWKPIGFHFEFNIDMNTLRTIDINGIFSNIDEYKKLFNSYNYDDYNI